jgi:hypothetical protein
METSVNSINQHGCSVCAKGAENYTKYCLPHRPTASFYQYDYRHTDGELFSTVAPTLEQCRDKRDKWKNRKRLFPSILKKIQENKRLTKSDMAYQIGNVQPFHFVAISWDSFLIDNYFEANSKARIEFPNRRTCKKPFPDIGNQNNPVRKIYFGFEREGCAPQKSIRIGNGSAVGQEFFVPINGFIPRHRGRSNGKEKRFTVV